MLPGLMKMPMVTGISFLWIRLSKTIGTRNWPLFVDVAAAVLEDHDAGRRLGVVLGRDVDPVIADGAGEDLALPGVLGDLALGHARLLHRVGAELVIVGGMGRQRDHEQEQSHELSQHDVSPPD